MENQRRLAQIVRTSGYLVFVAMAVSSGCIDGPLFQLKKLNPIIQQQWKEDRERGPTYSQRVEQFKLVRSQLKSMPEVDQAKWTTFISSVVANETSPEIRREAVLALNEVIARPEATATIVSLAQDKNPKVRLEVARSLKKHVSPETTQTLLAIATSDMDSNIRMVATESLGTHKTDDVKQFLAKQLNEPSPAVQYSASLALKEFTGKDFKGDMSKWKRYLGGEEIEPDPPSLAEALQSYVPLLR
ncbi:MAG: HEAT repeat domain-containing protein [Pirellula sp.]